MKTLSDKFVKYKDMWSCMSDEQLDIIGNSNFWLNEYDVKEAIKKLKEKGEMIYFKQNITYATWKKEFNKMINKIFGKELCEDLE